MGNIKAIETIYNGYRFRSRLEARWAVFFDYVGIEYEYEPEGIDEEGEYYLPDFYLPYFHVYFEVKRSDLSESERKDAERKLEYGIRKDLFAGLICYGDPMDDKLTLFCQELNDSSGGSGIFPVTFGADDKGYQTLIRLFDHRDRRTYVSNSKKDDVPTTRNDYGYIPETIIEGMKYARQVRFEHGENPKI